MIVDTVHYKIRKLKWSRASLCWEAASLVGPYEIWYSYNDYGLRYQVLNRRKPHMPASLVKYTMTLQQAKAAAQAHWGKIVKPYLQKVGS